MSDNGFFYWWRRKSKNNRLDSEANVPEAFTSIPNANGNSNLNEENFLRKLSASFAEDSPTRQLRSRSSRSINIKDKLDGFLQHAEKDLRGSFSNVNTRNDSILNLYWQTDLSTTQTPSITTQVTDKSSTHETEHMLSLSSKLTRPFTKFKDVAEANWTLLFTNQQEKNYNAFSHSQRLNDLDIACAYWLISIILMEIFNEIEKLTLSKITRYDLRIWYCISIGMTIFIWLYRLQTRFKRKINLLSLLLALNAAIIGTVYSIMVSEDIPNAMLFLVLMLIYTLLNIHFVLALLLALMPSIASIVSDASGDDAWKYMLSDVCFCMIANSFGLFHSYQRELYQRKVYLKMAVIMDTQTEILNETKKTESLLLATLPKKVLDELRGSTDGSQSYIPATLPQVHNYRTNSFSFRRCVTIIYADIVDFTTLSSRFSADKMVNLYR
jgi:hypothetical protein